MTTRTEEHTTFNHIHSMLRAVKDGNAMSLTFSNLALLQDLCLVQHDSCGQRLVLSDLGERVLSRFNRSTCVFH